MEEPGTSNQPIHPAPSGLKANVWIHFGFHGRSSKHVDRTHAVCRHCHTKLKYCGNTSNLRAHISRFHPAEAGWVKDDRLKPVIPPNQRTFHDMTKLAPGSERAKKITTSISYFIAQDMRPYSVVENQGFRYMVHSMEPRRITAFFHRSTTASHVLEQKQALLELPKHKLKTDAPTMSNSGFDMVDPFLEQQPAICAALISPQMRKGAHDICTLSEGDVSGAEHLVKTIRPMTLATTIMSEESMPTLSIIAPLHTQLLADFTPAPEDDPMTREIKHAIREDLSKR
ncbi:hypothetical protein DPEC_G00282430 [Dallia pectoralis]|uniref:Uncharacterized protein n=1 Tax=Dallia pectoralis TaxID=75939 RepID=A0ACC2FMW1_DALPE|nr:hypothetical protein DPEC_G00282430 [Dallia pectoralis]